MIAKAAWAVAALVLLLSALLQFNDPDPLFWVVAYAAPGAACLVRAAGRRARAFAGVALGLALGALLISAPGMAGWFGSGQSLLGDMGPAYVEEAREFIGSAVATLAALAALCLHSRDHTEG